MPEKVLLLNPPGKKLYIRDYYCSKVSKSNYIVHPVDLLMLSGRLSEKFDVCVIDAIADRLDGPSCMALIEKADPDMVIATVASVSLEEDRGFLAKLKKPNRRIVVSGDVVFEDTEVWLGKTPFVDAAILDFTSEEIVKYAERADFPQQDIVTGANMCFIKHKEPDEREYSIPVPRHDLFSSRRYRFPFSRHKRFATVLTDYGCPYKCSFCIMGTIGYKYRAIGSVLEELRLLKGQGVKEIYFSDQTFGINSTRTLALCGSMKNEGLNFGWTCFSRADLVTAELLGAMKDAGCHTVMLGVESASEEILRIYRKGFTIDQVRDAVRLCKTSGIRTVCTFILGLPEETEESALATIALARELDCDFASFNVAVPRMRTALREEAIRDGLITRDMTTMDQTGLSIAMPTRYLSKEQLRQIRVSAIKDFYLRPGYLWRRMKSISTFYELTEHLYEGLALIRNL